MLHLITIIAVIAAVYSQTPPYDCSNLATRCSTEPSTDWSCDASNFGVACTNFDSECDAYCAASDMSASVGGAIPPDTAFTDYCSNALCPIPTTSAPDATLSDTTAALFDCSDTINRCNNAAQEDYSCEAQPFGISCTNFNSECEAYCMASDAAASTGGAISSETAFTDYCSNTLCPTTSTPVTTLNTGTKQPDTTALFDCSDSVNRCTNAAQEEYSCEAQSFGVPCTNFNSECEAYCMASDAAASTGVMSPETAFNDYCSNVFCPTTSSPGTTQTETSETETTQSETTESEASEGTQATSATETQIGTTETTEYNIVSTSATETCENSQSLTLDCPQNNPCADDEYYVDISLSFDVCTVQCYQNDRSGLFGATTACVMQQFRENDISVNEIVVLAYQLLGDVDMTVNDEGVVELTFDLSFCGTLEVMIAAYNYLEGLGEGLIETLNECNLDASVLIDHVGFGCVENGAVEVKIYNPDGTIYFEKNIGNHAQMMNATIFSMFVVFLLSLFLY